MPGERRNLRSNKETSSSTNGEKARSNSTSSGSSKDKPVPTRATSSKNKAVPAKKPSGKEADGDKPQTNGTDPVENGVNGTEDVDMVDDGAEKIKIGTKKNGEEEMTVVVPPPKGVKLSGEPGKDAEGDVAMNNTVSVEHISQEAEADPKVKAIADIIANFALLERAVAQFDARFTLRVLRSISSIRKHLSSDLLAQVITETYNSTSPVAKTLLAAIGKEDASFESSDAASEMEIDGQTKDKTSKTKDQLPESDTYLAILTQIYLYDSKRVEFGAKFSSNLVERLRTLNRRTLDPLSARVYFYYSLFFEQLAPLPPSPTASVVSIRPHLLAALRTSVLRKDQDTRATVSTLLLRNYLSTSHITQADLLISHSEFPEAASNNQIARYLYYLGRIRAIQLSYTEAHEHLIAATRKSPATPSAGGFYQAASKLLVVVELLMGDIPDRAIFRQQNLEHAMEPYLSLVQAVRVGKIEGFLNVVQTHNALFRRDGTYTLILRLRQNVIKTGIRMMSLSYAKISLRDICLKLDLESEQSAEYIVAKAIRDGVIEASIDHEHGFMKSKDVGDVYATREPGEAFHERIRACLGLHDESVKAMRYPMNQHRLELKNAQEARERERELAKEIVEGDMDDDDAGGDFEELLPIFPTRTPLTPRCTNPNPQTVSTAHFCPRIEVSTRIRRAIHLNDLTLLKRIVKNNPRSLQNPDFADNGNTSLHLAAQLGLLDIADYLIDAGHEDGGISKNANWDTPLHVAVETSEEVAELLTKRFPRCIPWKNKQGADALTLTSRSAHTPLIPLLLAHSPPPTSFSPRSSTPLSTTDISGNTPLHYAAAYGQLKTFRELLEHGADASARNAWSWTPVSYSASVQAEVYFKGLVNAAEREREAVGVREGARSRSRGGSGGRVTPGGGGGVRLVGGEEGDEEWERMRMRAASGGSGGSFGRVRAGSGD